MQYFGVPRCPYCKKRVNFIRTWSLKRQGEYQCPRCGGISNIYLSPLIYVLAMLAVFAGGAVYFFHKFVLNDISLATAGQVAVPFAAFFVLSLFFVYLAKPVIKKVPKKKKRQAAAGQGQPRSAEERRAGQSVSGQRQPAMFYDDQEYLPKAEYRTGPVPRAGDDGDMKVLPPVPGEEERPGLPREGQARREETVRPAAENAPAQTAVRREAPVREVAVPAARRTFVVDPGAIPGTDVPLRRPAENGASSPENRAGGDDFFAKYDDPSYVERRLKELRNGRNGTN